jgi:hypothetical protein
VNDTDKFPAVAEIVFSTSIFGGKSGVVYTVIVPEIGPELPNGFFAMTYMVYVLAFNPVFTYETTFP